MHNKSSARHVEVRLWASRDKLASSNSNRHRPTLCSSLPPFGFSLSLFQQCEWLGWLSWQPDPDTWPACSERHPEKEQPTLVTMATHLLGVLILPETLVPLFDCVAFALLPNLLLLSAHTLSLSNFPSLFDPFMCLCAFTCVCIRVISRTRKAELPSSLWHVTVKSP